MGKGSWTSVEAMVGEREARTERCCFSKLLVEATSMNTSHEEMWHECRIIKSIAIVFSSTASEGFGGLTDY